MSFDKTFYTHYNNYRQADGSTPPPPTNQVNNAGLVEQAWKEYNAAIDATKDVKKKLQNFQSGAAEQYKKLVAYYAAAGDSQPDVAAANKMSEYMKAAVDRVNDAIIYEESKRQAYISISAANNIATFETVQTQQLNAQTALQDVQAAIAAAQNAISEKTGLSTPAIIGIIVAILILFFLFK